MRAVLDGDSVRLADGREVRLIGINAPEFGRDGRPDQPLAAAARERLAALVAGRTVRLDYDRERFDRHGRLLAYVHTADGTDVQQLLLHEGLAWFVAVPPNVSRLAPYREAERRARDAGRGVWAVPQYAPVAAERLAQGGFQRITGTVRSVRRRGAELRLRLADSAYLVLPAAGHGFPEPPALLGRRVLARGWVAEYKKTFVLRITHPAMLEVLP